MTRSRRLLQRIAQALGATPGLRHGAGDLPAPVRLDIAPPPADALQDLPIAAITTVWNEVDYLRKWVAYYGAQFGRENLYVLAHGGLPEILEVAEGCVVYTLPRNRIDDTKERRRARLIEGLIAFLLGDHRAVILGDADEYVVADPQVGTLTELVDRHLGKVASVKPLNLNILDDPDGAPLDFDRPILGQRRFARTRYQFSKPIVLYRPARFIPGYHFSDHPPKVAEGLYLVHLHFADRATNVAIADSRKATVNDMPQLARMQDRQRNHWLDYMGRYERYNAQAAPLPAQPLDTIAPQLLDAMQRNIVPGRDNMPGFGKTMSHGDMDLGFRIEIPDRFASVF